jgi:outer membrane protein TolC
VKTTRHSAGARKKPIAARYFGVIALTLLAAPATARTWTLEDAREQVLAAGRYQELLDAAADVERARGRAALLRQNPFIGAQHEHSIGGGFSGVAEDYLWLGHTFDLSGRRGALEDAGERRASAARLGGEARRRAALLAFETLFFEVLADERTVRALDAWVARLQELARRTRAREEQGDASRYDVLRLEREIVRAQQEQTRTQVSRSGALAQLATWLDSDPSTMKIVGEVRPGAPPSRGSPPRPLSAHALDEEAKALALEHEATERWYLPPITATAGGKTVFGNPGAPPTAEVGYLLTLQVPLPVFERGDARREELEAARRSAAAEAEAMTHDVRLRAASARAVWERALRALEEHDARVTERSESLVRTARAAWTGGELPLLALLEAERTTLDDELVSIELGRTARAAQLAYATLMMEAPR